MLKEEAKELFKKKPLGYEMKPELEIYTDGFKDGFNKAKEDKWHILAENDDDVPLVNSIVKVLTEDNQICESEYYYDEYFEEMAFSKVGLVKVLAWKEITPSKEV